MSLKPALPSALIALAVTALMPGFAWENSSREEFEKRISQIREIYTPVFQANGMELDIQKADWQSDLINAYVKHETRQGKRVAVMHVHGGLFRARNMTSDAFTLALCHEIGHALGGAPLVQKRLSAEAQADYFATLKCTRRVWEGDPSSEFDVRAIPERFLDLCDSRFPDTQSALICKRSLAAAQSLARIQVKEYRIKGNASLFSSSAHVVKKTILGYPDDQCRLDTMVAGALCSRDEKLSMLDPTAGACAVERGDDLGIRPACWYRALTPLEMRYLQAKDPGMRERSLLIDRLD